MQPPKNNLERILSDPKQGPDSHPELFRLLRESTLVFLMPYHPEVMGKMTLGNGDKLPKFSVWKGAEGEHVPIFSSIAKANEACKKIGIPDGQFALAEVKGEQLFQMLSCQIYPVAINPGCGPAVTYMDLNAVKKLGDGSILKPMENKEEKEGQVQIVEPADYPTDFLQSLFQFLRGRKEVKAGWLFREPGLTEDGKISYVFVLKADGNLDQIEQDFSVVATSACPRTAQFGVTTLDPANAPLVAITSKAPAFYAAPDYKGPSPL